MRKFFWNVRILEFATVLADALQIVPGEKLLCIQFNVFYERCVGHFCQNLRKQQIKLTMQKLFPQALWSLLIKSP